MLGSIVSPLDGFRSPFGPPRGFNPARLFGATDTGWFYDLSDMSTLFQDAAGTTPVTAVGQPVGLCLDKSGRGNHRSQSTSLPRPTYARHPLGGIRNLLTFTEQFDNAAWVKSNATVTANAAVAPDGTTTADLLVADTASAVHKASYTFTYVATTGVVSFYVKSAGLRYFGVGTVSTTPTRYAFFDFNNINSFTKASNSTADFASVAVTLVADGWYRVSVSDAYLGGSSNNLLRIYALGSQPASAGGFSEASLAYTGDGTSGILIWGAQLELGSTATAYQRVVSAFDVTEAGVPDLYYLAYDGTDDCLSTSAFAWGSDKATVVAGVRKLSDAATGMLVEFGPTVNGTAGTWSHILPDTTSAGSLGLDLRGNGTSGVQRVSTGTAPATFVSATAFDLSGTTFDTERPVKRINGAAATVLSSAGSTDTGGGNFTSQQTFFGARGGTSLFFNGREYSQFAINRLLTANELSQIERYTAQKTGVTL